jgi:hypothetical protein
MLFGASVMLGPELSGSGGTEVVFLPLGVSDGA